MGVSQSILKVIKSEVIRFPRLQTLRLFFSCRRFRPRMGEGYELCVSMTIVYSQNYDSVWSIAEI